MQAIMLAAGMGRRMGKYTEEHTKCMMTVGGRTLLERTVEALRQAGIKKLVMIIGYQAEVLRSFIAEKNFDIEIEYVYNYEYATTNNIYSLYLAREYLRKDDTILIESDLIYDSRIISDLVNSPLPNLAVVAVYEQWMDGTVVTLDKNRGIVDFIDKAHFRYEDVGKYYKTVNIYKFSREFSEKQYLPFLEAYLAAYGVNQYYEQVLKILSHIRNSELCAHVLGDENWYEIDDAQDLDIADTMFAQDKDLIKKYELHFGGYWRFPKLKDFCYLVNPYYPPKKMISQLEFFFKDLLTQYPSGMNIQRLNAGSMFDIDDKYLMVGNGAAELINVLGKYYNGTVSVCVPAFNEYIRCFTKCTINGISTAQTGYRFDMDKLIEAAGASDVLILVNPDNPSGSFLTYDEVVRVLDECSEHGTSVVIDESFVDFADKDVRYTLINEDILEKYPKLVVIKSISKSYGVPGLRLGIMATADHTLMKFMKDNMAIWNINSFAEYYLQIQRLYKKSYIYSCDRIAEQRHNVMEKLASLKGLTVYPSQANYIMCELDPGLGMTSGQLAFRLMKQYNILVKNLSPKKGFGGRNFLRFAIRDENDNSLLVEAVTSILSGK